MLLPVAIGDFTDFYASVFHATNAGRAFRPDNPLLPNYKYVPVAYHGRASSVRVSGTPVKRPQGQRKPPNEPVPSYGPSRNMDFELELGMYIGMPTELGATVPVGKAAAHIFGFCLLNDWSARDVQAWEYQPLGPFLGKNFATTVSPWVVTQEALAPFRVAAFARPEGDPAPLPYLTDADDQAHGGLDITLEAYLATEAMRRAGMAPQRLTRTSFATTYWTVAQMVAHHTCNGCNLVVGDLIGSGTVSGPEKDSWGSLLELTARGREPIALPSGEQRGFIEDGDEIIFRGFCCQAGLSAHRLRRMPRRDAAGGVTSLHRHPFLQPLSGIDFAGIQIAARIELGDVHAVELAGVAPGAAETADHGAVLAADGFQHFVGAVDQHEKILLACRAARRPGPMTSPARASSDRTRTAARNCRPCGTPARGCWCGRRQRRGRPC